jgi:hypothetical protein
MPLPPRFSYSTGGSVFWIETLKPSSTCLLKSATAGPPKSIQVPRQVSVARRQVNRGFKKCNRWVDCSVCSHSVNTTTHTCHETEEVFPITSLINSESTGLIYCISCVKTSAQGMKGGGGDKGVSGTQYIGCTACMLKTRFIEHVGSAKQPARPSPRACWAALPSARSLSL